MLMRYLVSRGHGRDHNPEKTVEKLQEKMFGEVGLILEEGLTLRRGGC